MPNQAVKRLVKIHNGVCHYCNEKTTYQPGSPKQATREHVVPRAFGGQNKLSNYVLACAECNGDRGTTLFYCKCALCDTLIQNALSSNAFINMVFEGIINHNRAKVFYRNSKVKWAVKIGHSSRHYDTWQEAMEAANIGFEPRRVG